MILHYLKVAVRSLMKYKMQNLIAICGVSLALFSFCVCLYCSRYIYGTDKCFHNRERIVEICVKNAEGELYRRTPGGLSAYLREQGLEAESFCTVDGPESRTFNAVLSEEKMLPYDLDVLETDSVFCTVFTPRILCGEWKQVAHMPNAVVLSESVAKRIFGSAPEAIGKQLILTHRLWSSPDTTPEDGGIAYTVLAVMEDLPQNNSLNFLRQTDALIVNDSEGVIHTDADKSVSGSLTYALLPEDRSVAQFMESIERRQLVCEVLGRREYTVCAYPFGNGLWENGPAPYFAGITLVAGILVLLVGLLNFFHFGIGSFFTRIREYSIRRVNGAGFLSLSALLFVQMACSMVAAGFLTYILIELLTPSLQLSLHDFTLRIEAALLMKQTAVYLLGLLGVCAVVSLLAMLRMRRTDIRIGLFGGVGKYGRHRIRNLLLGVQLFIGWIFLTLTTALYLQSRHTGNLLFGTLTIAEKEQILSVPMDYKFLTNAERERLVAEMRKCPDIEEVLLANNNYVEGARETSISLTEELTKESRMDVNVVRVSPNFFRFMQIRMESGKPLGNMHEMVIDSKLRQRIGKDVLGTTLYNYRDGYTVTGICEELQTNAYNRSKGIIFVPFYSEGNFGHCYLKCGQDGEERAKAYVEDVLRRSFPESIVPRVQTFMDDIREEQALEFKLRGIVLFMAVLTLLISMLGIYSAITLDTEYRRKEMAIRKVNGAGVRQIALLFARLYVVLLVSTAALAFPLTGWLLQAFSSMYASFISVGPLFYGSIFLSVVLLTVLTVFVRIRNITRVNPAEVIKRE